MIFLSRKKETFVEIQNFGQTKKNIFFAKILWLRIEILVKKNIAVKKKTNWPKVFFRLIL